MGKACCGKAAEGHGCGCGTMNAEEPVVQEPDWIPAGDGRAIGQQDFAINLSPLHAEGFGADDYTDEQLLKVARRDIDNHIDNGTFYVLGDEPQAFHDGELDGENFYTILSLYSQHHEDEDKAEMILTDMFKKEYPQYLGDESFNAESRFDKLSNEIADEYEEKGMSPEKAQEVGDATAAMIGRKKYGKKGMAKMQREGMNAEGFTDINYDAKIRLNNPKDAKYITPSIEDGMDFENGEGVLSSKSKIDLNAEGDSATYSPSDEPDMVNEIQTSPTNESPQLFNASNTFNTTTALGIGGLVVAALSLPMLYSSAKSRLGKSAEEKRKSNGSVRKNHTQVKNSEYSVGQVNPVEAEGQQDIHGAEGITNPRHSPSPTPSGYPSKNLKMW